MTKTPDENIIEIATKIAHHWHIEVANQKRKYSGLPYTIHTDEVEQIYGEVFPDDLIGRAIAKLHDTEEDTPLTAHGLTAELLNQGVSDDVVAQVVHGVAYLTDQFVREKHPTLNRATRKKLERERLATIPIRERNIKVADLISNGKDILRHDVDFARVFFREKADLLNVISDGVSPRLLALARKQLSEGQIQLGLS